MRDLAAQRSLTPVVLGSGLVALDLVVSSNAERPIQNYAGGTCGNVLTILSFLGWKSFPLARIGDDAAGEYLKRDLRRWNVKLDFLQEEQSVRTPVIVQQNKRNRQGEVSHRFSWHCPNCGSYWPSLRAPTRKYADSLAERLQNHDVFFFDRVSPATIRIAELSKSTGAVIVFEPAGVGDERLFEKALSLATVVKYSIDRISELPRNVRPLLEIRTLGKDGLQFRRSESRAWKSLPAIPVASILDTSGSGDWVTAGFLDTACGGGVSVFSEKSSERIAEALRFGQILAALNCEFEGARGAMYAPDLKKKIRKNLNGYSTYVTRKRPSHRAKEAASTSISFGDVCIMCPT